MNTESVGIQKEQENRTKKEYRNTERTVIYGEQE